MTGFVRPLPAGRIARIACGRRSAAWRVPAGAEAWMLEVPAPAALALTPPRVRRALHGLAAAVRGAKSACVVVPDATRPSPDRKILPLLLAELERSGIEPARITILVATGLHRPLTEAERQEKFGPAIRKRYRVLDHDARKTGDLEFLGRVEGGVPVVVHRAVAQADAVVSVGVVEPHQYAGYSGGYKTAAIGCAGEETIAFTHAVTFLDDPAVGLGRVEGNPFAEAVRRIGQRIGVKFVVNVLVDARGRAIGLFGGPPEEAFARAVRAARRAYEVRVDEVFDAVAAGVGWPKDVNLYQATRAATALGLAPRPVVRPGGAIVLAATCPEGAGRGEGERRFYERLTDARTPSLLVARAREVGLRGGEQRAYLLARVLERYRVTVVGPPGDLVVGAHMRAAATLADALRGVRGRILFLRDGLHVLPVGPEPEAPRRIPQEAPRRRRR